jgi:putative PIN family toxin of toxin-antitoxin system
MQRLVLDTNVWLDWLVFNDAALAPLKSRVGCGQAEIVMDAACDGELVRVLGYPLQKWTLDDAARSACIANFRRIARIVDTPVAQHLPACRDPDDQKFLVLAAGTGAHCLITKDRDLLKLAKRRHALPFHIVTPANFNTLHGVESTC